MSAGPSRTAASAWNSARRRRGRPTGKTSPSSSVLSPLALADPALAAYADRMAGCGFPLVPVVADLAAFDFRSIPPAFQALQARNAVGASPADAGRLMEAVRGNLGLESFLRQRKVFLSYRRSDAAAAAQAIYEFLWGQKCAMFLDQWQLPGGAVVQPEIMLELHDKDFVLFIDSPEARDSRWVEAELERGAVAAHPGGGGAPGAGARLHRPDGGQRRHGLGPRGPAQP